MIMMRVMRVMKDSDDDDSGDDGEVNYDVNMNVELSACFFLLTGTQPSYVEYYLPSPFRHRKCEAPQNF